MNKFSIRITALILTSSLLFSSCETMQNVNGTQKGAAGGVALGAILGAVIGNNSGNKSGANANLGAIIGAAVGGIAGGVIGHKMDKQAQKIENTLPGAKVERVGEGIQVVFDEAAGQGVYFETGKYTLNENSANTLAKLAQIFQEYPDTNISVEGHTDNVGKPANNLTLSKKRAEAVVDFLKKTNPAMAARCTTGYHGDTMPKYDNDTPENRSKNRRVEFNIVANEKMKTEAATQQGN